MTNGAERAIAKAQFSAAGAGASALQFSSASEFDRPPPMPVDPIVRQALAISIFAALAANGAALIAGSAGRGKSAAAALAAAGAGGRPLWIELEGLDAQSAAWALERALVTARPRTPRKSTRLIRHHKSIDYLVRSIPSDIKSAVAVAFLKWISPARDVQCAPRVPVFAAEPA